MGYKNGMKWGTRLECHAFSTGDYSSIRHADNKV